MKTLSVYRPYRHSVRRQAREKQLLVPYSCSLSAGLSGLGAQGLAVRNKSLHISAYIGFYHAFGWNLSDYNAVPFSEQVNRFVLKLKCDRSLSQESIF